MIRAVCYLGLSGLTWLMEGFLFSFFLGFAPWQVIVMACLYMGLFGVAVALFLRAAREPSLSIRDLAAWRYVSLGPMFVVIVGSFVSLPLMVLILALGKVL